MEHIYCLLYVATASENYANISHCSVPPPKSPVPDSHKPTTIIIMIRSSYKSSTTMTLWFGVGAHGVHDIEKLSCANDIDNYPRVNEWHW